MSNPSADAAATPATAAPPSMTTHKAGRTLATSLAILLALGAALPFFAPEHIVTAGIVVLLNCYLAQCWNLAAGYAGQFSLGHSVFIGIGGYTSTILFTKFGLSPWLGCILGGILAAGVGTLLAMIVFRYRIKGVFFAVVTLSAAEVVRGLFENWDFVGSTAGVVMVLSNDPGNMMFNSRTPYFLIALAMVGLLAYGTFAMERTRFGQYLIALREDEDAAEASGVPTYKCKVAVIALSAFCTAFGGTFYAQFLLFIVPETMFSFEHVLTMMLGAMIGGAGTVIGPIVGSVIFGVLAEALRSLPFENSREIASGARIVYALVLMVIVIKLPGGIVSLFARRQRSGQ
ncbi:MAG: branched-chain amino acid ABC transporter permease [Alphaproteobacteria bacterium]